MQFDSTEISTNTQKESALESSTAPAYSDARRAAATRAWERSISPINVNNIEPSTITFQTSQSLSRESSSLSSLNEGESLTEHLAASCVRLDGQKIEQRDRITRLGDDFRRLDKSALASMLQGKKNFLRHADLVALLQRSRNCLASDPRDRIYAFFGLAEPGYHIVPNYQSTNKLEHVLTQTAKSIILHDRSLRILQHVHRGRTKLGVRLPSWVPDWTSKETIYGVDHHDWRNKAPFTAGGETLRTPARFECHGEDHLYESLRVSGVCIGEIEKIERPEFDHVSSLVLESGQCVLGPRATRLGDELWVLFGAARPAVLRRENENRYNVFHKRAAHPSEWPTPN